MTDTRSLPSSARDPQEFDEAMARASNEMLARWVLKNMGSRRDDNVQFLSAIFAEHRRQCTAPWRKLADERAIEVADLKVASARSETRQNAAPQVQDGRPPGGEFITGSTCGAAIGGNQQSDKPQTRKVTRYDEQGNEREDGYLVAYDDYAELEKDLAWARRVLSCINRSAEQPTARVTALIADINGGRYGKPLAAALMLCNELAMELEVAKSAKSHERRTTYEPMTKAAIETVRPFLIEAMTDGEGEYPSQVDTICDMAINAILYAEEIHRLRALPSASVAIPREQLEQWIKWVESRNAIYDAPDTVDTMLPEMRRALGSPERRNDAQG